MRFCCGQKVYLIENQYQVRSGQILSIRSGLYTVRFTDGLSQGAIRVRSGRLYAYPDDAHAAAERHRDYAYIQQRYVLGDLV